jgi:hypothetical protein
VLAEDAWVDVEAARAAVHRVSHSTSPCDH